MKTALSLLTLFISTTTFAAPGAHSPLHLDLLASSWEYRELLKADQLGKTKKSGEHPTISRALRWGDRLNAWLISENAHRAPSDQLRLSTGIRSGIPITKPSVYSPTTIEKRLQDTQKLLPKSILAYLDGAQPQPKSISLADDEFLKLMRKVDGVYQSAARYKFVSARIDWYRQNKRNDLRAYYFFKINGWDRGHWPDFERLVPAVQKAGRPHLANLCAQFNDTCRGSENLILQRLIPKGQNLWNSYFKISDSKARSDLNFTDPRKLVVPFQNPGIPHLTSYLKDNVEDEYKFGDWRLQIRFTPDALPRLEFEAGTLPHVNGIGGNQIVMDANQSVDESSTQWTIRHEFGHVLGFPDCYLEFYDDTIQAFVSYQLDTTDLMCSRAGNMNKRIHDELVRVYAGQGN